ncbi:twin transmembrane helix small protein [Chitiniphilus eburneus]|uniref:Twin transmembrane helix small protein n=1 Tax=Chitiniphilus eburneus TaxID=2571148 RepID=A0A4U0PR32_9NEIS|nr:twin transmembrane helix small protein [Chitiniphilus eburneus]TJZ70717.1 twin transmembrane helix small protein [Chitiniphilus eburneus]
MKVVAIILLIVIIAVLGRAMLQLVKGPSGSPRLVRSLTLRVALSILLFLLLLLSVKMGWLTPHGV